MREAFISILVLAIFAQAKCSDIGKDGFNYYKDYLRARSDLPEGPVPGERMLYFYRTPLQLYPSLLPALEQEYKKRTVNAFKNHMLNKELWTDGEMPGKRSSKTGLALLMQNKQPYYMDVNHYCLFGK
ncbi:uncharacterized protein LOC115447733 isoform X2 [Manduca sexta]|uniref:Uncharacterized protein n=2 Tax=Manduca sexta TaxID=7130 RepID=A0A921YMF9_MANSE|nr:uncharacterized protein LOC115447733 isoform X2 [Manduca sexta]KAG6441822.1 hypothetical protein O3G_MSEX002004 [Manduca sexta]